MRLLAALAAPHVPPQLSRRNSAPSSVSWSTGGMSRAAAEYAGDFMKILQDYSGPHFGFAVKNYYAEFLAADQVHRYEEKYFPGIESEEGPPPPSSSPILRPVLRRIVHHFRSHHHHAHVKQVADAHRHDSAASHRGNES